MVEILWKSNAPHLPKQDHELVELRLIEVGRSGSDRFLVREIHAAWSAAAQAIEWKSYRDETYGTPQEARRSFENRKASMHDEGYAFSTVLA